MKKYSEIEKEITPREFELLLKRQYMSHREFEKKIFKGGGFVNRNILRTNPVCLRWVDHLIDVMGETNYNLALKRIRQQAKQIEEANKPQPEKEKLSAEKESELLKNEKSKKLSEVKEKSSDKKSKNLADNEPENSIFYQLGM